MSIVLMTWFTIDAGSRDFVRKNFYFWFRILLTTDLSFDVG